MDPELLGVYEKLGISAERAEDARGRRRRRDLRHVSVGTTIRKSSRSTGSSSARSAKPSRITPSWSSSYLGTVVPHSDNFFAALNAAVFSDGSFCYVPKGVKCPMELSTYFRINSADTGQFERTLIVADEGASVSYLEGCTAPKRDTNQLHAAVVELVALDNASIKYSTVQNWYAGDSRRKGRHLQLRDEARQVRRRQLEDFVDAGRDRLGDHVEVSRA